MSLRIIIIYYPHPHLFFVLFIFSFMPYIIILHKTSLKGISFVSFRVLFHLQDVRVFFRVEVRLSLWSAGDLTVHSFHSVITGRGVRVMISFLPVDSDHESVPEVYHAIH